MMRRFRMLLPPDWVLVFFGVSCVLALLPGLFMGQRFGVVPPQARRPPQLVLGASLILYGVYRVLAFHPAYRAQYRRWLELTPWRWPGPLPVGPIQIVWEDVLIVASLAAIASSVVGLSPAGAVALFLGGYLAAIAPTFWVTGIRAFGYATLFLLASAFGAARRPEVSLVFAVVDYAIARVGLLTPADSTELTAC
jgi:hypothetical protein